MNKPYKRKLLEELRTWVDKRFVVVVTGMRQVGKTTLFRMLFDEIKSPNKAFLDLENPIVQKVFQETNYDNVWANLKPYGININEKAYIFLDEIQTMPEVVKVVKYLFDHYQVQFFTTGSSSFYLKNLFPESLAGRKVLLELYPLDFEELLWFNGIEKEFYREFKEKDRRKNAVAYEQTVKFYEEYLSYGGFPRVVLASDAAEKNAVLDDIFTSYFEKDVRSMSDFKGISVLRDLILLLMQRVGSKLNLSRIASELGVSRTTIHAYLSFLEATYFVSLVAPFSSKVDREVSGAKKVYLCDTGILNRFAKVSSGAVLENAVFNVLKKLDEIRYYQRRSGKEIDFLLKEKGVGLEVKEKGTKYDKHSLQQMKTSLNLQEGYVVSKAFVPEEGFICAADL
ncbi:MAG: ATP-binding protein [Candidatus Omnitrophota bacterium]|nr:ATP-binding protein [Candidatus Omnitrophota bacterium]